MNIVREPARLRGMPVSCLSLDLRNDRNASDGSLVDHKLASVVAAFSAYSVIKMPCAAIRTDGYCGYQCFVMCATLRCAGMRLSAFRMCHCSIVLIVFYFGLFVGLVGYLFVYLVEAFVKLVAAGSVMLVESGGHGPVAFAQGVYMAQGDGENDGVI